MKRMLLTYEEQKFYTETLAMIKTVNPEWRDLKRPELEILQKGMTRDLQDFKEMNKITDNQKIYKSIKTLSKMLEHIKLCLKYAD